MNKKTWDLYAPIYKRAMKADQKIYDFMYERIPERVKGKEVLEIATGPGLLLVSKKAPVTAGAIPGIKTIRRMNSVSNAMNASTQRFSEKEG